MNTKFAVDVKLVFNAVDPNDTQIKLKQVLKQIMDIPDLDIFLREPNVDRYDRLTH